MTIKVWDMETGDCLHTLHGTNPTLLAPSHPPSILGLFCCWSRGESLRGWVGSVDSIETTWNYQACTELFSYYLAGYLQATSLLPV